MISSEFRTKKIRIRKKLRDSELGRIRYNSILRHRVLLNAIFNMVIFAFLLLALVVVVFKSKMDYLTTVPSVYTMAMMALSVVMIFYDIKSVNVNSSDFSKKPHWYNIVTMLFYSMGLFLGFSFICFQVIPDGIHSYVTTDWSPGYLLYLIIPLLSVVAYSSTSIKTEYSLYDAFMVSELIFAFYFLSFVMTSALGVKGSVVDAFCSLYALPYDILLIALSVGSLYLFNRLNVKVSKINEDKIVNLGWRHNAQQMSLMGMILSNQRTRNGVYLLMNVLVLVISVRTIIGTFKVWPGCGWASVPGLMSAVLIAISILSIPMNIRGMELNNSDVYPVWYKYLSFIRCTATFVNLTTAVIGVVVDDAGILGMFEFRWGGDGLTFVLCPALAVIFILLEATDISALSALYCTIPLSLLVVFSRIMIDVIGADINVEKELAIFFDNHMSIMSVFSIYVLGALTFVLSFINANDEKFRAESIVIEREKGDNITLSVCGARDGIAPTSSDYYEFGQASNCFVLRDGSYGLVIDCGSGLVFASEKLKGCTNVDIVLSNTNFSTIMGLLAVPNPCPKARVRIWGPFGKGRNFVNMNGFATPPLWPVNVIVGECISALPNRDIPLNNMYSVRFTPANEKATHYMVRISGAVSIAYTGAVNSPCDENMSWAEACDLLICNDQGGPESVCGLASDIDSGYLLLANHGAFENDESLNRMEMDARKLFFNMDYARQGTDYILM